MATETERLMRKIDDYLARTGWKASTLGQHINGDRTLIARIEKGTVTMATLDKVRAFIADNPPPKKRKSA